MSNKYFLGWINIKWFIKELVKLASNEDSFFSKKRMESGIAFWVLIWGCIFWLIKKYTIMTTSDFLIWSCILASIAGYSVYLIEKSKQQNKNNNNNI
jgi:hypothetical protein